MEERGKMLIEKIRRERDFVPRSREILARDDPDYLELYHNSWMHVMHKRNVLPLKFKELIIVAVDAVTGYERGVKLHIESALKAGATKEEILEALEAAAFPGGIHVLSISLPILDDVLKALAR